VFIKCLDPNKVRWMMSPDSSSYYRDFSSSGASIKNLLLFELEKAKKRFKETPHPYCELDCPWLSFCQQIERKYSPIGCILNDLIDSRLWVTLNLKNDKNIKYRSS
jgi:hypothetical protein